MPHTQPGGIICLPLPIKSLSELRKTLLHELVHVWQRQDRDYWDGVLQKAWQAAPCPTVHVPEHARINPDTHYAGMYAYANKIVPFVLLGGDRTSLQNIELQLVDTTGWDKPTEQEQEAFLQYFGASGIPSPAWLEHPYETAAYIITEYVTSFKMASAAAICLIHAITPDVIMEQLGTICIHTPSNNKRS